MRDLRALDEFRDRASQARRRMAIAKISGLAWPKDADRWDGCFSVQSETVLGWRLWAMASAGDGWDHISVRAIGIGPGMQGHERCCTWAEMEQIKRLFFKPTETAMQLHVPPTDHVNVQPYVLHLWRPQKGEVPRPPNWMVA